MRMYALYGSPSADIVCSCRWCPMCQGGFGSLDVNIELLNMADEP